MIFAAGWIFIIAEGAVVNGRLPLYGDIETVSFNGWDRIFIQYPMIFMLFGGIFWLPLTLVNSKTNWFQPNETTITMGFAACILDLLIILSPYSTWALD